METKKTSRADLEGKKKIFFQIGLTSALAAVLFAFEWKTPAEQVSDFVTVSWEPTDEIIVPITQMNQPQPPPPPPSMIFNNIEITEEVFTNDGVELSDAVVESPSTGKTSLESIGTYGEEETVGDEILPFLPLEDMPQFPGNINKWLSKNIVYPETAQEYGIEGKVYVQFVVEKDGSISNVNVTRGVDPLLDKEAVRVIQSMPKWTPGKQRKKPVRVAYNLPITFQLAR